ncbi:hypothetical protein ECANGB1_2658 [Enterospora canceri]|uniref:Secreted protein n=1 Tax=Enterospora canceri TaxID=1081671 RepID=A0A1Y1S6B5_9MICR|nr:hypothetical protein ECANGB1_2658 [Enterospora canceri]
MLFRAIRIASGSTCFVCFCCSRSCSSATVSLCWLFSCSSERALRSLAWIIGDKNSEIFYRVNRRRVELE